MNVASSTVLGSYDDDVENGAPRGRNTTRRTKFQASRRFQFAQRRKRPKHFNGIHRRRNKKIDL